MTADSAVRGIGVVTLAFGGLVITNVCVLTVQGAEPD